MTRTAASRLRDIIAAGEAIASHLELVDTAESMAFDAVRIRLIEIGEATKDLPRSVIAQESDIPWAAIARMRDHLAHRYFDTSHAIVFETARRQVPLVVDAARRLTAALN